MKKQILLTIALFVVALISGIFIGRNVGHPFPPPPHDRSWLTDELHLTDAQKEQMRQIWSDMLRGPGPRHFDQRRQAARERDEAIAKLIMPQQKSAYDAIIEKYNQDVTQLSKDRETAYKLAVEKTKAILNPQQREKYEKMLAAGTANPPWQRPGPSSRPASRPLDIEH